jgi:uncharacterized protein YndB with AHSA1/START domain
MIKKILLVLAALILIFVVIVALQPADYRVERSATMAAPPATVFEEVNDFHNWDKWSPWAKLDPAAKYTFEGPSSGTGAILRWAGNSDVGEGSMTILESRPSELIRIKLAFIKPFEDTATVEFTFKPEGDKTNVTWSMFGKNNFIGKAMCMFMSMDKMVGDKYAEGLANLKAVAEAKAKP